MGLKLFYGEKPQFQHEFSQLKEIIATVGGDKLKEEMYVLSNVLVANGDIDCVLLTQKGPIIIELKNYTGEIIGDENSDWFVRVGEDDIPLNGNLYQNLKNQRNDLFRKLDRIRENNFPRIESEDLRKISAWGYFNKGSFFPEHQINLNVARWFDIVTVESLNEKLRFFRPGYTLSPSDMEIIVRELHLVEWPPEMIAMLEANVPAGSAPGIASGDTKVDPPIIPKNYSKQQILEVIEKMAPTGHAPDDGCILFDIGNEKYINAIKKTYFENIFARGGSAEKFIVGPFGSGKTHLVSQICEVAREMGCVSATVALNKLTDVTSNYYIYREVAKEIRPPGVTKRGIQGLMESCLEKIDQLSSIQSGGDASAAKDLVKFWITSLEDEDFESDMFSRVAKQAFEAYQLNDRDKFEAACRWIGGEFDNKEISKILNISPISKPEQNRTASRVNLSLYQLIHKAGFKGTIIAFDEAEQGFEISKSKQSLLYSLMQSDINAINSLKKGSVLVLYAIVPAIKEGMMNFPALQQRVQHPIPFDKNPRAPLIEIGRSGGTSRDETVQELVSIANKLVNLAYYAAEPEIVIPKQDVYAAVAKLAERTYSEDMSVSGRRILVKGTCSLLMVLIDSGELINPDEIDLTIPIEGIDTEV
jgi:hypothetical protein